MNGIAFDPGIANTGVAYNDGELIGYRTLTSDPKSSPAHRIAEIVLSLTALEGGVWDYCVIEDYVGAFGNDTKKEIGALIAVAVLSERFYLVHPKVWVKEMFPKSRDYKKAAMKLAKKRGLCPRTQHEADAICLHEWGRKQCEKARG